MMKVYLTIVLLSMLFGIMIDHEYGIAGFFLGFYIALAIAIQHDDSPSKGDKSHV